MDQAEGQAPTKTDPTTNRQPAKRAKRLRKPSKAGADGKLRLVTLDHLDNRTIASRRAHHCRIATTVSLMKF